MAHPDTLGGIGERAALGRIIPHLPQSSATLLGPGDDCAVITASDTRVVVTTDMMIHGPDFRLAWSSPHDLGWKAAATNLSDIAAMGAVPTALVVAIAAPAATPVSDLEAITDGLRDACAALAPGCGVVGGDLSVSPTLTIAVTALGDLEERDPVTRSGARPGDVVAVSGGLGEAALGLSLLFEHGVRDGEPDAAAADAIRSEQSAPVQAQLAPSPPIADGPLAAAAGATAMIDLSDGLALDASRVARASGVRIDLDSALLRAIGDRSETSGAVGSGLGTSGAGASGVEATKGGASGVEATKGEASGPDAAGSEYVRRALGGGEDHSLLATFPQGTELPGGFRAIGSVSEGEGLMVDTVAWTGDTGWDPYRGWDGAAG